MRAAEVAEAAASPTTDKQKQIQWQRICAVVTNFWLSDIVALFMQQRISKMQMNLHEIVSSYFDDIEETVKRHKSSPNEAERQV